MQGGRTRAKCCCCGGVAASCGKASAGVPPWGGGSSFAAPLAKSHPISLQAYGM